MSGQSSITLLGGPSSGKTTYMGAVIRALRSTKKPAHLVLKSLPEDATGYNRLSQPLAGMKYPQRTKAERHRLDMPMQVNRGETVEDVSLLMGDYDGEEVERLFKDRNQGYSDEWKARAHARGILLFLRPDALTPLPRLHVPEDLSDRERLLALKSTEQPRSRMRAPKRSASDPESAFGPGIQDAERKTRPAAPNDRVQVPTILAVIELLQFLRHERDLSPGERPRPGELRIALLASAWDAADVAWQRKGPREFFAEQAPLLEQFLASNYRREDVTYFGLSSTGGDLNNEDHKKTYRKNPHGYVEWPDVTGRIHRSRNLALPIEWALFGDEAFARTEDEIVHS